MKLYYFYTLNALWDGHGKIKMYYGMSRVKKQLSEKRSFRANSFLCLIPFICFYFGVLEAFAHSEL